MPEQHKHNNSVVVNGTTLTLRTCDNSSEVIALYDGLVTSGSGLQNVVITWGAGSFLDRDMFVWTATGLATGYISSTATIATGTQTVTVQPGDFVFSTERASTVGNYSTSDQAPAAAHTGGTNGGAADWTIGAITGSFVVRPGGGGISDMVTGVYR